ncbi:MAG: hypothetical protein ACM3JQ_06680 [Candidatus Eiseniibacteriota bacterium]
MNIPTSIKFICGMSLGVFLFINAIHLETFAKPEVSVSPSCGPKSGFVLSMQAKGFESDGIVSWKLVDSNEKSPLTGYFHADTNGEVNDQTSIGDVKEGHYQLYIGKDKNSDGELDSEISQSEISIPCEN